MKKSVVKIIVAGVAVCSVMGYLMFSGLSNHSVYYLEVSELLNNPEVYKTKNARLSGDVVSGSIEKDALNAKELRFEITDDEGSRMFVTYSGVVPDALYDENAIVILEGKYDQETTTFHASTLMAKCPSKYETEDPAGHNAATSQSDAEQSL